MKHLILMPALLLSLGTIAQTNSAATDSIDWQFSAEFETLSSTQQYLIYGSDTLSFEIDCNQRIYISQPKSVQIVDSIDLNNDGVKELFVFRKWSCESVPPKTDQFCVGCETNWYEQYEVWDIKSKRQIFTFTSLNGYQRIVSTNVIRGEREEYAVSIDKKGSFHFEKLNKMENEENTDGKYKYDAKSGTYILKN